MKFSWKQWSVKRVYLFIRVSTRNTCTLCTTCMHVQNFIEHGNTFFNIKTLMLKKGEETSMGMELW